MQLLLPKPYNNQVRLCSQAVIVLTFIPIAKNSKSAPFIRVPNGGFMTTVSTTPPAKTQSMRKKKLKNKCQIKYCSDDTKK